MFMKQEVTPCQRTFTQKWTRAILREWTTNLRITSVNRVNLELVMMNLQIFLWIQIVNFAELARSSARSAVGNTKRVIGEPDALPEPEEVGDSVTGGHQFLGDDEHSRHGDRA
eukprot:12414736-Karenia_brevis.AAC.1